MTTNTWTRDSSSVDVFDAIDWTSDAEDKILETYWRQLDQQFAGLREFAGDTSYQRYTARRSA